ncbi:hypothetical protein LTR28_005684, partial [Elasticomyces elasticus]
MHYLRPPLLHRDLKVENVLISVSTKSREMGSKLYKLCDFGSTAPPRPAATNVSEGRLIEEDVQRHTTLQYRSPEMIDIWRKRPIDEKSDIWALGVLLYKLCYYTTPFEELGQMAILNASFKYPSHPAFSTKLKALIGTMLREDPKQRPNIYQVVSEACRMRGKEVPIKDIYSTRTQSEARSNEHLPTSESPISSPPAAGLTKSPPPTKTEVLPTIAPMRRGRPTAPAIQAPIPKVNPSPARGDPFAALDSKSYEVRVAKADELSSKFPSLDEFALAHGTSGSFRFPQSSPAQTAAPESRKSMTDALADQAFTRLKTSAIAASQDARTSAVPSRATSLKKTEPLHVQPEAPTYGWRVMELQVWMSLQRQHERNLQMSDFDLRVFMQQQTPTTYTDERREKDEAILEDRDGIETETSFLRAIEDEEGLMMKSSRNGSGHRKRASMPSNSLSGTKNIVMGKFGNAFRRFEVNTTTKDTLKIPAPPLTERGVETRASPSIDSEAMPDRSRDSGEELIEETEDLPPEMRREMERRRLSQEERRVAEAAAEYRNRISGNAGIAGGGSRPSKASTIQKRVQSLLEEGRQSPVLKKTAEGYGRFTDSSASDSDTPSVRSVRRPSDGRATPPVIAQKSPGIATTQGLPYAKTRQQQQPVNLTPPNVPLVSASAPPIQNRTGARPSAPPKPKALRTGNQNLHLAPSHQVAVPGLAPGSAVEDDGWEADFSQRFPTLTGIEMVETEIERVTGKVLTSLRAPGRIRHPLGSAENDYEALSYTWGGQTPDVPIECDGCQVLVTRNLDIALRHFRHQYAGVRKLWVDAICIDQSNLKEREAQVSIMKAIYHFAKTVLIWIGEAGPEGDIAFEALHRIRQDFRDELPDLETLLDGHVLEEYTAIHSYFGHKSGRRELNEPFSETSMAFSSSTAPWDALRSLLHREYFSRVWIIQEIAL